MKIAYFVVALAVLSIAAGTASAQQQVRLKSGGVVVGAATVEGGDAAVKVGDATMRIPLTEVAEITAVAKAEESVPRRLLTAALEARILSGTDKENVGVLAEASRLAPDDPQIAFWYATSLLDAGHGAAAGEILAKHRAAIDKAYPGFVGRLASRIEQRRKLEGLPAGLVERIDAINSGPQTIRHSNNTERRLYSAIFRLVDQYGAGIAQNAYHIQCNGYDEQLQVFPGGYGLLTFTRDAHRSDEPSIIDVKQLGLKPERFELDALHGRVGALQEFTVHRFGDSDKRTVRVQLVDRKGEAVASARIELEPVTGRGRGTATPPEATTGRDGDATLATLPGEYYIRGQAPGFSSVSERVNVVAGKGDIVVPPITMYRTVSDSLQVQWRWKPAGPAAEEVSGDATISLTSMRAPPSQPLGPYQAIQAIQIRDRLALHLIPFQTGGYSPQGFADVISLRQLKVEASEGESLADAMEDRFELIDLKNLAEIDKELKRADFEPSRGPGLVIPKPGLIYVVKMPSRDMRSGQMGDLTFKLMLVEGESGEDKPREEANKQADVPTE